MRSAEESKIITEVVKDILAEKERKRKILLANATANGTIDYCEKYLSTLIDQAIAKGKDNIQIILCKNDRLWNNYKILKGYTYNRARLPYKASFSSFDIDLDVLEAYLQLKGYKVSYLCYKDDFFEVDSPTGKVYGTTYEKNTLEISW